MKNKKKMIIIIAIAVVALAAIAVVVVMKLKKDEDSYRIIKVYECDGKSNIYREGIGDIEPYNNMVLESGDVVTVDSGSMTLKLDDDKYVYVESDTKFKLVAEGTKSDSKTYIDLEKGAITNEIQNKLSDESSYEINTQNSTMSVRGTIFRVCISADEDGKVQTKVSVFDGTVNGNGKDNAGELSNLETDISRGGEVIFEQIVNEDTIILEKGDIDYSDIPPEVIENLITIVKEGTDIGVTVEQLEEYLQDAVEGPKGPFTVTFMYNGSVFGTQTVEKGELVNAPKLKPAADGKWDYDFSTPVTKDITIEWK